MDIGGKRKGSQFERDVCKFLSKWLTGKEKPYQYWRQHQSGGLATIHPDNVNLSGDICALTEEARFLTDIYSIEVKVGYPRTSFWHHFKNNKEFHLRSFWEQCTGDAKNANKRPMLIYKKKSNRPVTGIYYTPVLWELLKVRSVAISFDDSLLPLTLYNMEEFFKIITPEVLKMTKFEESEYIDGQD